MMIFVFLVSVVFLGIGYFFYSNFIAKRIAIIDEDIKTPAHTMYDGVDYVPTRWQILLGHHFSSIAGAGPIVGPILAGTVFGWLPPLLWILFGAVFIGAVHDFTSLFTSIRHKGRSIAEVAREHLSRFSHTILLLFVLFTLMYVIVVFTDLTAYTFSVDGGVTTSSIIYVILAILFGVFIYRLKWNFALSTVIFVALVFGAVWFGNVFPFSTTGFFGEKKFWSVMLIIYCYIASVTPVWILLQPRDYLSSFLLYACILGGSLGILLGGFHVEYPVFTAFHSDKLGDLIPILFITVACGAVSGFHSIVASGTTAKQLNSERDARPVAYGAMLIEALVAVVALGAVMIVGVGSPTLKETPMQVFSSGMGSFLSTLGINPQIGKHFALLALSTFLLTSLDTCTRLARYVFEELLSVRRKSTRFFTTLGVIVLPVILVLVDIKDIKGNVIPAWQAIWPVFGSSNQLLAGLALLVVTIWFKKTGRKTAFVMFPMVFMVIVTVWSLTLLVYGHFSFVGGFKWDVIGLVSFVLLVLAFVLVIEASKVIFRPSIKIS